MGLVYCLEDDEAIREMVLYALRTAGFEARGFETSTPLYQALQQKKPELIILDIMLPGEDGVSVLKHMKSQLSTEDIPVIMLTAKSTEFDKVTGLDCGADDYVTKPFGILELLSRIRAVLRRADKGDDTSKKREFNIGGVLLNIAKHTVHANGNEVILTLKEFELLHQLMLNRGIVLTRDKLMSLVWDTGFEGESRTVDVHIQTLRQKLGDCGDIIETVRGVGYKISE